MGTRGSFSRLHAVPVRTLFYGETGAHDVPGVGGTRGALTPMMLWEGAGGTGGDMMHCPGVVLTSPRPPQRGASLFIPSSLQQCRAA